MLTAYRDFARRAPATFWQACVALALLQTACDSKPAAPQAPPEPDPIVTDCTPTCDGTRCDNGCGGSCSCAEGKACAPSGACVAKALCTETCESAGYVCGEVCGHACGACSGDDLCFSGACLGSTGCTDCALELSVLERSTDDDQQVVKLAVLYHPADGEPLARLADVRLQANRAVRVVSVSLGEAATEAGKGLYIDATTGQPWVIRENNMIQALVHSFENTSFLKRGRLLTITLTTEDDKPLLLSLVRRSQVFAPASSDAALQGTGYDKQVIAR